MQLIENKIKGSYKIIPLPHEDERGCFFRTYDDKEFATFGIKKEWVQENHSFSKERGIIRGLHFQYPPHAEAKLVRAASGEIFIVIVDLRKGSDMFGKWESHIISEENKQMIFAPRGIAMGMCTLSDNCTLLYKMDNYYSPENQGEIKWDDPDIGIDWPINGPVISERDAKAQSFSQFKEKFMGLVE